MANNEQIDIVVGVDFGMTYTGVAWTNLLNAVSSVTWPGLAQGQESKVPTKIAYDQWGNVTRWGIQCEIDSGKPDEVYECFKIFLDQGCASEASRQQGPNLPANVVNAKQLTTDYLRQIYQHTARTIQQKTGSWKDKRVEFIFSTPTTWRTLDTANVFLEAIRDAGFGAENPMKHSATLELTEAEAAAVQVVGNPPLRFSKDDILLICDAGGGTTDLGLVEVQDPNPELPALKQVAQVSGVGVGSTMIDAQFRELVQQRMNAYPGVLPAGFALKLSKSPDFQVAKQYFGTSLAPPEYHFSLAQPWCQKMGINQALNHHGMRISADGMHFSSAEIRALFDTQIKFIIRRIDQQLDWMRANRINKHVKYLILSGGLGGSAYVETRIKERYGVNPHTSAPNMVILVSDEPRLTVVRGLVTDRRKKLTTGKAGLTVRIARASYGVLCRQRYDPMRHVGAEVEVDAYDKKVKWAKNQFEWLIRIGDEIEADSYKQQDFNRKITPGSTVRKWNTEIYISNSNIQALPRMLGQSGAFHLCTIESDLESVGQSEFERKNKRCWQGPTYYLASFQVRVIIAPVDLKFELWFKGQRLKGKHNPVKIEFHEGARERPPSPISRVPVNAAY